MAAFRLADPAQAGSAGVGKIVQPGRNGQRGPARARVGTPWRRGSLKNRIPGLGSHPISARQSSFRAALRDPDLPVRYGGEEFALLLPHTQKAGALILAERIRELAQAGAPAAGADGAPVSGYTLSLGVATLPTDALSARQLLLAADNAELAAKRAGKNRVCAADPLVPDN